MRNSVSLFGAFIAIAMFSPLALAEMAPKTDFTPQDWAGGYVGLSGGYTLADTSYYNDFTGKGTSIYTGSADLDGMVGSLFGGANFNPFSGAIVGVEADVIAGDTESDDTHPHSKGKELKALKDYYDLNLSVSVRARMGWAAGRFLPYATGGLSVASEDVGYTAKDNSGSGKGALLGYTAGAGFEYAYSEHIRIRAEYRFTDYFTSDIEMKLTNVKTDSTNYEVDLRSHLMTVGFAWTF